VLRQERRRLQGLRNQWVQETSPQGSTLSEKF
jgi:hypothetical protein